MIESYYLVGFIEKDRGMIPVIALIGDDKIPLPLFITEDEAVSYRNNISKHFPNLDYYCLKATIIGAKDK